jgi:hypothetical protein
VVFLYVDDKIIPSANVEWGLERLHLVLDVFRRHNLKIKMPRQSSVSKSMLCDIIRYTEDHPTGKWLGWYLVRRDGKL